MHLCKGESNKTFKSYNYAHITMFTVTDQCKTALQTALQRKVRIPNVKLEYARKARDSSQINQFS